MAIPPRRLRPPSSNGNGGNGGGGGGGSKTVNGSWEGKALAGATRDASSLFDSESSLNSSAWLSMHPTLRADNNQRSGGGGGNPNGYPRMPSVDESSARFLEFFDAEGNAYYHCPADGSTVWELPPIARHMEWVRVVGPPVADGQQQQQQQPQQQQPQQQQQRWQEYLVARPRDGAGLQPVGKDEPH